MLERYLGELKDPQRPLSTSKLANLSGLTPEEVLLIKEVWPDIEVKRRRLIVRKLADLAEDNLELNFDEILRLCLEDPDDQVRVEAVEGLWECQDRWLIDALVRLSREDPQESVRAAAASALGKFAMLAELDELSPRDAAKVQVALLAVIDSSTEPLEVRRRAIESIIPLSQPRVKDIIREAYESGLPKLKISAVYAMGRNCDPTWLATLVAELSSPDPEMRFEAAAACGEVGDEAAVPYLAQLLHDPDPQVQLTTIEALGRIGGMEARRILTQCLNDPDPRRRQVAEEALEELAAGEDLFSFGLGGLLGGQN